MKKFAVFAILAVLTLALAGCQQAEQLVPLKELPGDYSLEQAKKDGCVVHEDGDVTQGKDVFKAFMNASESGKPGTVRLAFHYTLGDPSRYDPAYYESIKDDYPVMYVRDLSFDGKEYTIRWYEDGKEISKNYQYLLAYQGAAETPGAAYQSYERYVLTNDEAVTWPELMYGLVSSQFGDYIDHESVCTDLIYG